MAARPKLGLPQSVKHLLTLRNPNVLPGPPAAKLNSVLAKTLNDATEKKAETGWLVLTTCTLLTCNRPSSISQLYRFVTGSSNASSGSSADASPGNKSGLALAEAINKAALMRESALKSTIFVGVPRVILSLAALHETLDDEVKKALRSHSRRTAAPDNVEATLTRGRTLWDSIYEPHAQKLFDKLGSYHPDFIAFIIQSYGAVLSPLPGASRSFNDANSSEDPDQGNLSRAMGSVVGTACLRAEERVVPQLTSHVFGLLKARHEQPQTGEDAWLSSDEGTEWVIRTVDEILDVVDASSQENVKSKL